MKLLIIAEDLRVSGTSEGQVSRSFIYKMAYHPRVKSIDLLYLRNEVGDHKLELLPVNQVWQRDIIFSKNHANRFVEKVGHKLVGKSLEAKIKLSSIVQEMKNVDLQSYDFIAVRSTGHSFLTLRACRYFPHLIAKIVLFFHDPFPVSWDPGYVGLPNKQALADFMEMKALVNMGFKCVTPSLLLSKDLRFLYGSKKDFLTLPHQFTPEVFEKSQQSDLVRNPDQIVIMYHGAIQLGRKIEPFLDVIIQLMEEHPAWKRKLKLIFRIKGNMAERLKEEYSHLPNLEILPQVPSHVALWESQYISDINVLVEPAGNYSNILVGKAPLLDYAGKRILILGPNESELRRILTSQKSFASADSRSEIKKCLIYLIKQVESNSPFQSPFADYFSNENFLKLSNRVFSD